MVVLDISKLIEWVVAGLVGFIFGVAGAWVAYRFERRRDDIAWSREREKLEARFEDEKALLELQFRQRLRELEQQQQGPIRRL